MVAAVPRHGTDGNDHPVDVPRLAARLDVAGAFVQQPIRWLRAITDYRVTITVGPNFSLDLCANALIDDEAMDLDLSSVKELYCGAEPIHTDTPSF